MSVLMEFAMFPTDKGDSVSADVSEVIKMIKERGVSYKLTAMGTIIETETMQEALAIVQQAHDVLEVSSKRIYSTVKFDIRKNTSGRLSGKIHSVEQKIGKVAQ
ncbi:MAG: MTH1187 family thiamine-binding protein [Bacteroidales bacterium]|nr:MTH1187 family thiamine-binding protein [Bacteroidales bacterium]